MTEPLFLPVKKLDERATLPSRAHETDAGYDFYSLETKTLPVGGIHKFRTGIAVACPEGSALLLWDRSGLAAKHGLHRLAGVVDEGYRGEVQIVLVNLGGRSVTLREGDRIAQGILTPVLTPPVLEVEDLDDSDRGSGGFGSTGN